MSFPPSGRLAEDSPMHHPPKTKYSLARNKCISVAPDMPVPR